MAKDVGVLTKILEKPLSLSTTVRRFNFYSGGRFRRLRGTDSGGRGKLEYRKSDDDQKGPE